MKNDSAKPKTLNLDNEPIIDSQIEELEKIVAPAVNAYLPVDGVPSSR
jgi:hypothetical protein